MGSSAQASDSAEVDGLRSELRQVAGRLNEAPRRERSTLLRDMWRLAGVIAVAIAEDEDPEDVGAGAPRASTARVRDGAA